MTDAEQERVLVALSFIQISIVYVANFSDHYLARSSHQAMPSVADGAALALALDSKPPACISSDDR